MPDVDPWEAGLVHREASRLPRGHPLREAVGCILEDRPIREDALTVAWEAVHPALRPPAPRARSIGAWVLGFARPSRVNLDFVMEALRIAAGAAVPREEAGLWKLGCTVPAGIVLLALLASWESRLSGALCPVLALGVFALSQAARTWRRARRGRVRAMAMLSLGRLRDTDSVVLMSQAITREGTLLRRTAQMGLLRILEGLTPGEAERLTEDALRSLSTCLALPGPEVATPGSRRERLEVAMLRLFASFGYVPALWLAKRLARVGPTKLISQVAGETASVLHERQQAATAARTLLRPASDPMGSNALLRPAAGPAVTDPQLLLRPTGGDSAPPGEHGTSDG